MNFNYKKSIINYKGKEYTICVPNYEFKNTFLNEVESKDFFISSSKEDFRELSNAIYHISQNQNSILYIALNKKSHCPLFIRNYPYTPPTLDLVCTDAYTHFSQTEWKEIRKKIKKSYEQSSAEIDDTKLEYNDYFHFYKKANKDYLDVYRSDSTMIISGSSKAYYYIAYTAKELSNCKYSNTGLPANHLSQLFKSEGTGQHWNELTMYLS